MKSKSLMIHLASMAAAIFPRRPKDVSRGGVAKERATKRHRLWPRPYARDQRRSWINPVDGSFPGGPRAHQVVAAMFGVGLWVAVAGPTVAATAETAVGLVSWEGVRAFKAEDLAEAAKLRHGVAWCASDSESACRALLEIYRTEGYLDASAEFDEREREGSVDLTVRVSEGTLYRMGEVQIEGTRLYSQAELLELCPDLRRGAPFSKSRIEKSIDRLLRQYGERGYADCLVSPRAFSANANGTVDFTIAVTEGRTYAIEEFTVKGGRTRSHTVSMIAGLKPGAALNPWSLKDARARLVSSGLFSRVSELSVRSGSADSLAIIEADVDEAPSSSVSGLLGYSGREGGAVGFVDLKLGNILGTARSGSFRWESSGGGLSSYGAHYREPWLGPVPMALEIGLDHVAQDTTYSTTGISGAIRVSAGRRLSFGLGAIKERTAVTGGGEGHAVRRSRVAVSLGAEIDARDSAFDPCGGVRISATGDWGSRTDALSAYSESKSWRMARVDLSAELHRRLHGQHGLFIGARWRKVYTDEPVLPWDQLLRFGGASSLRGYREDQFRAQETGLVQLEHRIAMGEGGSRLFLFTDFGILSGYAAPQKTLVGYGLGIRAATSGGIVGLDYGLGKGDSWSEGKIHVRLVRTF